MIDLITGLPGNSKTLWTIGYVKAWSERDSRPVYYSGIPELTLDWQEIDPTKWMDCPPGAIVVIDECQRIFRNRSLGAQPPKHVVDLETHRHMGIDLVFITQHPSLVDPAIRKLTQKHRHMVRAFGMEVSTVHAWDAVRDNCDKPAARKDSDKTRWKFDRSLYKLYKSADQHTFKRSFPMRLKLLMAVPFVLAACGWFVYNTLSHRTVALPAPVVAGGVPSLPGQLVGGSVAGGGVRSGRPAPFDAVADAREYVAVHTPRVEGLAHTAPVYDEITKPVRAPVPAMCIQSGEHGENCRCLTQQSTPMDVPHGMCVNFARNGFFQDFDAERDRKESQKAAASSRIIDDRRAVPEAVMPSQVVSLSNSVVVPPSLAMPIDSAPGPTHIRPPSVRSGG